MLFMSRFWDTGVPAAAINNDVVLSVGDVQTWLVLLLNRQNSC